MVHPGKPSAHEKALTNAWVGVRPIFWQSELAMPCCATATHPDKARAHSMRMLRRMN